MGLRRFIALAVIAACVAAVSSGDDVAIEKFTQRACKFPPLPRNLDNGFTGVDGTIRVSNVFGISRAGLAESTTVMGTAQSESTITVSLQAPHGVGPLVYATLVQSNSPRIDCIHGFGAGGRQRRCELVRQSLQKGGFVVKFWTWGFDGIELECVPVRFDLEVVPTQFLDRGCPSENLPPQISIPQTLPLQSYAGRRKALVVWSSSIGISIETDSRPVLYARLAFPFVAHPLHLLLEELTKIDQDVGAFPACNERCVTGTPTLDGQVLQRLLAPGIPYRLWILGNGAECVQFDFEFKYTTEPVVNVQQQFHLGPPAWLCEGSVWPNSIEQVSSGTQRLQSSEVSETLVLRGRSIELQDIFELTQFRGEHTSDTGLHSIGITVAEKSVLRVSTFKASVHVKPLLLKTQDVSDRIAKVARIPQAGGEFSYAINTELEAGSYVLAFVVDHPLGGLRPCASVLLRLELTPLDSIANGNAVTSGACSQEVPSDLPMDQVLRPVSSYVEKKSEYTATLPSPSAGSFTVIEGEEDLSVVSRASFDLLEPSGGSSLYLRLAVSSPYLAADFRLQVYRNGKSLIASQPVPSGFSAGYVTVVGPLRPGRYTASLLTVPRHAAGSGGWFSSSGVDPVCSRFSVDISAVAPTASSIGNTMPNLELCRMENGQIPKELRPGFGAPAIAEGEFLLPSTGTHEISVPGGDAGQPVLLRVAVSSQDAEMRLSVKGPNEFPPGGGLSTDYLLVSSEDAIRLTIKAFRRPTRQPCPTFTLHVVALRLMDVPACPWRSSFDASSEAEKARRSLEEALTRALKAQMVDEAKLRPFSVPLPPKFAEVKSHVTVNAVSAELRVEVAVDPPWLPLEVFIDRRVTSEQFGADQRSDGSGDVWARAKYVGRRLILLSPDLPKGEYNLRIRPWENQMVNDGGSAWSGLCAQVTIGAILVEPHGRDTSNFRAELLDLPELLAVPRLPSSMTASWMQPTDNLVFSQMYQLPGSPIGAKSTVVVKKRSLFRILAEPADLLAPRMSLSLEPSGIPKQDLVGSVTAELEAGTYTLTLTPLSPSSGAGCGSVGCSFPFYVTLGMVVLGSPAALGTSTGSVEPCADKIPALTVGSARSDSQRYYHKAQQIRVQSGYDLFALVPLEVTTPSVVSFAVWSEFAAHHIRSALKTEEGLWVGEQRGRRGSLEIELPPGKYDLQVQEVSPAFTNSGLSKCIAFGISITMTSMLPPTSLLKSGRAPIMSKVCAGLGASGLPLDFVTFGGGAQTLGGPVDNDGRMLIRRSVMLTDIHDGRKKVFLKLLSKSSLFRVVIGGEQASEVEVLLEDAIAHAPVLPSSVGRYGDVRTISYRIKSGASGGFWLSFHREHRLATATGCASFDLLAQLAPITDYAKMTRCPKGGGISLREAIQRGKTDIVLVEVKGPATETLDVSTDANAVVFVEVEFNVLLSDVRLWMAGMPARPEVGPEVSAANVKTGLTNARVTLQLGTGSGSYEVKVRHALAFPDDERRCVPLRIRKEVHPLSERRVAALVPKKPAPVAFGGDFVMVAHLGNNAYTGGSVQVQPTLGGEGPSGVVQYAGVGLWIWDYLTLKRLGGSSSTNTRGGQKCWILPFCVDNKCFELDVVANWDRGDAPWVGGNLPVQNGLDTVSVDDTERAISELTDPLDRIDPFAGVSRSDRSSGFSRESDLDKSFGGSFDRYDRHSKWDPVPKVPGSMTSQKPRAEESVFQGSTWFALLCLGMAYTAWKYPHVVETYARKYLPASLVRSGLQVYHGGSSDSSGLFGGSTLELTNPASGPTDFGVPTYSAPAKYGGMGQYGTVI